MATTTTTTDNRPTDERPNEMRSPLRAASTARLNVVDWIALVLTIVGGLNWGLVGLFNLDLVASIFGVMSAASRGIYVLVGLAALYEIVLTARLARGDTTRPIS